MKGYAPGWQVRCLRCGLTFDAADLGWTRLWARGTSYKALWCSQCHWLSCFALERKGPELPEHAGPRNQWHAARAPGAIWRLRCGACGETFHVRRLWRVSKKAQRCRKLRWCGRCRRIRRFVAEREQPEPVRGSN
ncbi:MAG: hypothetical protein MUP47_10605 [Phycisphaerae bacterium]|nr:hypothetical protein [Phycisphaerae bacterium]